MEHVRVAVQEVVGYGSEFDIEELTDRLKCSRTALLEMSDEELWDAICVAGLDRRVFRHADVQNSEVTLHRPEAVSGKASRDE